jgi:LysM repeat protein
MEKKMAKTRRSLPLGILAMFAVLSLLTGCFKAAAPDVTDTPAGAAPQAGQPEEGTPDLIATAREESARATQLAGGTEQPSQATEEPGEVNTPTSKPPTPETSPTPTTVSVTAAPTFTPTPVLATQVPATTSGETTHVVQVGENLFRIALKYGTTVQAIAAANGIANPAMIYVGQELTVPSSSGSGTEPPPVTGGTTYTVQRGDNLFRIALRYNMSYIYLAQYNNIANPASIYAGQVLQIPSQ